MGLLFSFCSAPDNDLEIDYKDYIYNHQEIIVIKISPFLAENLKYGDYIVLEMKLDDNVTHHTCLVKRVCRDKVYVMLINPLIRANSMKYIKNVIM